MLHQGRISPAALPSMGQIAPKMYVDAVRWSCGADGREPRWAQRRAILFFWPMRAWSPNHTSMTAVSVPRRRATDARRAAKFF